MTFVQIIDCRTRRADELNQLMDQWVEATEGKRTATHAVVAQDRADATHVVEIVEFPSYEEAMKNSGLPETDRIFREMVDLCEAEPTFTDLDVVRDEQLNLRLARRFFDEVVNAGDASAAAGLCAEDYREHDAGLSSGDLDLHQAMEENQEIFDAFHPQVTPEAIVAQDDTVAVRFSYRGRHTGDYQGIAATGREVTGTGHATLRCADGKIAEGWWNTDDLGLLQQLGALPDKETAERNKAVVREAFSAMSRGAVDEAFERTTADYVEHDPANSAPTVDRQQAMDDTRPFIEAIRPSFTLESQLAEGDRVCTRWTAVGRHDGPLLGVEPTGRTVTITGQTTHRLVDGAMAEAWFHWDLAGLLMQLGLAEAPSGRA
jgi:predicted ester cyclase